MGGDHIFKQVEKTVIRIMTRFKIPGISLAILSGNKVAYAKGFGVRDIEKNLPATQNTLYGIGSCTKSFTALAIPYTNIAVHDDSVYESVLSNSCRHRPLVV